MDPRYVEGFCERCSPRQPHKGIGGKLYPTPDVRVLLFRADDQRTLDTLSDAAEAKRRKRLLDDLHDGRPMSKERKEEAEAILAAQSGVTA